MLFGVLPNSNMSIIFFGVVLDLKAQIKSHNSSHILQTASRLQTQCQVAKLEHNKSFVLKTKALGNIRWPMV